MFEDAVALALTFDGELAARIARQPEGDEGLSRKLWLAIARHLIQQSAAEGGPPKARRRGAGGRSGRHGQGAARERALVEGPSTHAAAVCRPACPPCSTGPCSPSASAR